MHLNHPAIIKFHKSFRQINKLYFLLEHCPAGSLADFLNKQKTLNVPLARHFTAEIVTALEYLREKQIVHRDLKLGNIVLEKDFHLKLIDFGTAKVLDPVLLK